MDDILTTVFSNRCPRCREGLLFTGWFQLAEKCEHCGAVYHRHAGSWTGPTVVGYMLGVTVATGMILVMWGTGNLWPGAEFLIAAVTVVVVLASFRFVKAGWVGMLHGWGMVYPDPPAPPAP